MQVNFEKSLFFAIVTLNQLVFPKMMQHNSLSYFCCCRSPRFLKTTHNTVVFCLLFESYGSHEFERQRKKRKEERKRKGKKEKINKKKK